ncbi:hypothetical protein ALC57_08797 [Trachymyrmex cornetzi]|uniref:Uncharacterized protein n=1 Tax=Trachymyrmex cornetzi TaxID=471704 RepID=A0A151J6P2_9HYME|nr:hypothetical protein ALC57_08797 [Trachymyrmex cornetzi]
MLFTDTWRHKSYSRRKNKTSTKIWINHTVQPYIIVIGPTLTELHAFYVCLNKALYQVSTVLEAVDICFKVFHVFDLHYPPESEHIWYTIQNCLYKFSTKYDKQISYVMPIINTFKTLRSTKDI